VTAPSLLDQVPPLSELLDVDGFREICKSFGELYGIGIKLFDVEGGKLVDVRAGDAQLSSYLFGIHETQVQLTSLVNQLRTLPIKAGEPAVIVDVFVGLRYKIAPIVHEGSLAGRVIFGTYAPGDIEVPAELGKHKELDLYRLQSLLRTIPVANEKQVDRILAHLSCTLDVVIHSSYKQLMTSRLHIASISGAFEDLERVNKTLQDANGQLKELDRLKSNFIATVSHELRTPLTSVIGYSEMLLEGMAGDLVPEQRDYVKTILEKGESLLGLIGQVLDLSRIDSGNVLIMKTEIEPAELVKLALSDVLPQAKKRNITLETVIAAGVKPIAVDTDKIRRILVNLLGNAVKFTPEGGKITVKIGIEEDKPVGSDRFDPFEPERNQYLRIDVIDTGIGIPEDKLERVFDSFFQVDNSSTRQFGGTGLGLSIARNFAAAHRGTLNVSSTVGAGSTFTLKLPYVAEAASESVAPVDGLQATPEQPHTTSGRASSGDPGMTKTATR
jgi:signal transduction histidine kinase